MTDDLAAFYDGRLLARRTAPRPSGSAAGARSARARRARTSPRCAQRAGVRPRSLVEIGCGDGALLGELAARGLARHAGRLRALRARRRAGARTGESPAPRRDRGLRRHARAGRERRLRPRRALARARARARARRAARRGRPGRDVGARRGAARGQPLRAAPGEARRGGPHRPRPGLRPRGVRALVAGAGLAVAAELSDPLPRAHHAFFAGTGARAAPRGRQGRRSGGRRGGSPRARAERLFTVHYALLATGAP